MSGEFVVRYPIWEGWRETGSGRSRDLFCRVEDQYEGTEKGLWLRSSGELLRDNDWMEWEQRK